MIFQYGLDKVIDGSKTQTRRIVLPGDTLAVSDEGFLEIRRMAGKISFCAYRVGQSYAANFGAGVQPAKTRILILNLRGPEDVRGISPEDVIAEGFAPGFDFAAFWRALHGPDTHYNAWALTFRALKELPLP